MKCAATGVKRHPRYLPTEMTNWDDDFDWFDDPADLSDVLREALSEEFGDATPDDLDDALLNMLESMSAAEAFNFTKAMQQIQKGAATVLADPKFGSVVRTALPAAGGAAGTIIGGPVGTAVGSSLGSAAAKALPAARTKQPGAATPSRNATVSDGSAAAAQALVLTQQPEILKSLLAVAMGETGRKTINGVPVTAVMNMLSNIFGQAAADADEISYFSRDGLDYPEEAFVDEPLASHGRSLYAAFVDAENDDMAEIAGMS